MNSKQTERFIQFGTGGFLRGFADWMIQRLNDKTDFEGSVVVVQNTETGLCHQLTQQNCRYTHILRGAEGVETETIDIISRCVNPFEDFAAYLALAEQPDMRFIISNTTEAGIVFNRTDSPCNAPYISFPAKLTLLMKRRFDKGLGGFILLPCELTDRNGETLKQTVLQYVHLWKYPTEFAEWVKRENVFCDTLVDRINTGYPKGEAIAQEYDDKLLNASEHFHLWVIETDHDLSRELPFTKAGLNVIVTKDQLAQYRTQKVRILNGAHTALVPYALLSGFDTVKSCMDDPKLQTYLRRCIFDEIIPTLDLPRESLQSYAESVLTRFANPYIKHYLSAIALNSVSKFKVRVLPSILEYKKRFGTYPPTLMFAFARQIEFYKTDLANDLSEVKVFMRTHSTGEILANEALWGCDLSSLLLEVEKYENT